MYSVIKIWNERHCTMQMSDTDIRTSDTDDTFRCDFIIINFIRTIPDFYQELNNVIMQLGLR